MSDNNLITMMDIFNVLAKLKFGNKVDSYDRLLNFFWGNLYSPKLINWKMVCSYAQPCTKM